MSGPEAGVMPHPAPARISASAKILPDPRAIALACSILEPRLARSGLRTRCAEHEALRVLAHSIQHPVQGARVAVELLDQRVEARQGFVVERARGNSHLPEARGHPVESLRALLQLEI